MTVLGDAVFVLWLRATDFNDKAICLGPQVAAVLDLLMRLSELSQSAWYAAWVDAMGADKDTIAAMKSYESSDEVAIPDIQAFIALSRNVTQFLDGIFFAVPLGHAPQLADGIDKASDTFALNGIVEVRAHDTTIIEIVSDSRAIVDRAQLLFGGSVIED